ncbi:MAG: class I SAM-dependent methyltransferase [Candidatus Bathyarchaeia archaeon]
MSKEFRSIYEKYLSVHLEYAQANEDWGMLKEIMAYLFLPHLPADKQAPILEVGCGRGNFLKFLSEEGYQNFLGVDISPEAVGFCQRYITDRVLLIEDLQTFLREHRGQFEAIVMLDVLEHIPKAEVVSVGYCLREALTEGGRLIVKTLNAANPWAWLLFGSDLTHEQIFSEISLREWCLSVGFSKVNLFPHNLPAKGLKRRLRLTGRSIVHKMYRLLWFFDYISLPITVFTPDIIVVATR